MVHVPHLDAGFFKVGGQVLRHFFGQGSDQHSLPLGRPSVDLPNEVVNLSLYRPHINFGIEQAGGTDDLFSDESAFALFQVAGRGAHADDLFEFAHKFIEFQRAVIQRRGQPEPILDECFLAAAVAAVHAPGLRQRHMALINEDDEILGEII